MTSSTEVAVRDATLDYIADAKEAGCRPRGIDTDLDAFASVERDLRSLVHSISRAGRGSTFERSRPDVAMLTEQICDLIDDALGGPAGTVIRALARREEAQAQVKKEIAA